MRNRARLCMAVVLAFVVVLIAGPAGAQEPAAITVTPSTGLTNGQTVTVQGSGFAPNTTSFGSLTVGLCPSDILTDPTQAPFRCSATAAFPVPVDDAGHFVAQLQVFRTQPTSAGGNTLNCGAPAGCVVLAIEVIQPAGGFELIVATAPVTFAALTKQDCKKNGWRALTDNHGRPFRNQGQCIQFVNTGK